MSDNNSMDIDSSSDEAIIVELNMEELKTMVNNGMLSEYLVCDFVMLRDGI